MSEPKNNPNNRLNYLTLASVISAIAVVTLHTNGCFWTYSTDHYWYTANIIECIFYFAVPVFFMITGATLLDFYDKYSLSEYFKKRAKKACIPFVVWTFIGMFYRVYFAHSLLLSDISSRFIFDGLTKFNIIGLYWFFGPLFCVYLSIPLLAAVAKEKRVYIFAYVTVVSLVFNVIIPLINNVFTLEISCPLSVSVGSGYLLYVILGYLLSHNQIGIKLRILSYFFAICGLLVHIIGTYRLSIEAGQINGLYKGYNNLPCIAYSIGVFIAIKQVSQYIKFDCFWKIVNFIGSYTFPIYLMQWFFLDIIERCTPINKFSLYYRLGAPIPIVLIIILICLILRKIPIVKYIVP